MSKPWDDPNLLASEFNVVSSDVTPPQHNSGDTSGLGMKVTVFNPTLDGKCELVSSGTRQQTIACDKKPTYCAFSTFEDDDINCSSATANLLRRSFSRSSASRASFVNPSSIFTSRNINN